MPNKKSSMLPVSAGTGRPSKAAALVGKRRSNAKSKMATALPGRPNRNIVRGPAPTSGNKPSAKTKPGSNTPVASVPRGSKTKTKSKGNPNRKKQRKR